MNNNLSSSQEILKVLIIDDDLQFRKLLQLRLKAVFPMIDFLVFDSLEATRKEFARHERLEFDLVIIDQHLPDGRGTDFLQEGHFADLAVLSISSDDTPDLPATSLLAGAMYFLKKEDSSAPLFAPLVRGLVDRNRIQKKLRLAELDHAIVESVKTLVGTLRHEINNPLGAVLGAAYLLRVSKTATPEEREAATLIDMSGKRIKTVLDQLCNAMEFETVEKARHTVFAIPGDEPWEEGSAAGKKKEGDV